MESHEQQPEQKTASDVESTAAELPSAIDMERSTVGEAANYILRMVSDTSRLPQRSIRNAGALAGGFVRESANWLIPSAFRNSKSYSMFVQQMLDFVITDLGGVKRALAGARAEQRSEQVELARKTVGNLLDMTAFATFHVAPVTTLALVSDIAYGRKVYLKRLGERLRRYGIISTEGELEGAADLIAALEQSTELGKLGKHPISLEGLRKAIAATRGAVSETEAARVPLCSEIDQLWMQMEGAAEIQHASVWDISAVVSIITLNRIRLADAEAVAGLQLSGDLFQLQVVQHYWAGLREIERHGLIPVLSESSQPFLEAIWSHFGVDQKSWTELLLSGELLRWGWSQLSWPKLTK